MQIKIYKVVFLFSILLVYVQGFLFYFYLNQLSLDYGFSKGKFCIYKR
jgi:hypothetical protein